MSTRLRSSRRAAVVASLLLAACSDPAAPLGHTDSRSIKLSALPPTTVLGQRAVQFTATFTGEADDLQNPAPGTVTLLLDAGTPQERATTLRRCNELACDDTPMRLWVDVPTDGRHRVTVQVRNPDGSIEEAWFEREFQIPDAAYTMRELPGLGGDSAYALGLNEQGDVAGWARSATGPQRAVVWRGSVPTVLPASDALDARAIRINASGDVLGEVGRPFGSATRAHVWRADGAQLPIDFVIPGNPNFPTHPDFPCCVRAVDLSDRGEAVAYTFAGGAVVLDVATGAPRLFDRVGGSFHLNSISETGMVIGSAGTCPYSEYLLEGPGFPLPFQEPPAVAGRPYTTCSAGRGGALDIPVAIDDVGRALISYGGRYGLALPSEPGIWLDEYLGDADAAVMSRRGGVVAALYGGDVYVWRLADRTPRRIRIAEQGWRFDALGAVNAQGVIAAHGVHVPSGRRAAVLLTPASGAF